MKCASEVRATRASAATSSGLSYARPILSRARNMRRLAASTPTTLATIAAPNAGSGPQLRGQPVEGRAPAHLGMPEAFGIQAVDQLHPGAAAVDRVKLNAGDHGLGHAVLGHRV